MTVMQSRSFPLAQAIFAAALEAVEPYRCVTDHLPHLTAAYLEGGFERLVVAAFGKAAYPMAKAVTDHMAGMVTKGVVLTKYGHTQEASLSPRVALFEAAHPVPDERGFRATEEIVRLAREADGKTFVVCLISGGGSALLVAPYPPVTLGEKQELTGLLLKAGADIKELNTVRKHLSQVKGGRLAEIAYPARVASLILSDVIGDRLDVIASGPTAPDESTFAEAWGVIEKYGLASRIPAAAARILLEGCRGEIRETPKGGHPAFLRTENMIVASNGRAVEAARARAVALGFEARILSSTLEGEAREVAAYLAREALETRRTPPVRGRRGTCLIAGGETTVTVKGDGLGGRNTELALAFSLHIEGQRGITFLSAGTDGTDGPTDAAGAFADGDTAKRARAGGLDPALFLDRNDSYTFFRKAGGLFITGPTGTNVMDLQIILIDK